MSRRRFPREKNVYYLWENILWNRTDILQMPSANLIWNKLPVQDHTTCQKNKCHIRNSINQIRQAVTLTHLFHSVTHPQEGVWSQTQRSRLFILLAEESRRGIPVSIRHPPPQLCKGNQIIIAYTDYCLQDSFSTTYDWFGSLILQIRILELDIFGYHWLA